MKIVGQSAELINIEDPIKKIEYIGRVCYGSQNLIKEGSADKFVGSLVERKHYSPLEHAHICFNCDSSVWRELKSDIEDLENKFHREYNLKFSSILGYLISGNFRAWLEFLEDYSIHGAYIDSGIFESLMKYSSVFGKIDLNGTNPAYCTEISFDKISYNEQLVHRPYTIHAVANRAIQQEFTRHRHFSYTIESTRYIGYDKEKFGNEIKVIVPDHLASLSIDSLCEFREHMESIEAYYKELRSQGVSPQNARDILPLCLASDMYITGTLNDWIHFDKLRRVGVTGTPHPQIKELATMIHHLIPYNDTENS